MLIGNRPAPATSAPAHVAPAGTPAPRIRAAARGGDPLPSFPDARAYQNYVINLVSQARQLDRDIETTRAASGDKPGDATVAALRERLDAVKLQLKILRDDYPLPAEWTRSRFFLGQGFDKEAFWRDQVEAIPGKAVMVTPAPAAPARPPQGQAPAPAQAPPLPNQPLPTVAAVTLPVEPADPAVAQTLRIALAAHQKGMSSSAGDAFRKATSQCRTAGDAMAVFRAADLKGYSTSAGEAAARATGLAGDVATLMAIAEAASNEGYSSKATEAFEKATATCRTWTEALQVALLAHKEGYSTSAGHAFDRAHALGTTTADGIRIAMAAHQKGYSSAAGRAYRQATALATTSAEALQVSEAADRQGYGTSASAAMKRALELP